MDMMIRRIFTSSIVAMLLSVSSLAAACDLSCAFASMNSGCHAEQAESQDPAPNGMKMNGMAMAGMAMPDMANGEDQQSVSAAAGSRASHALFGQMGPCERQTCDNSSAVSAKSSRPVDSLFHSLTAITEASRASGAPPHFHDARDDVASYCLHDRSSLQLSLRI
jgi:hypothetical protein